MTLSDPNPEPFDVVEFLRDDSLMAQDRLETALNTKYCTEQTQNLFICDCVDRALQHVEVDSRSTNAVKVARNFFDHNATSLDLELAREEALAAALEATDINADAVTSAAVSAWLTTVAVAAWLTTTDDIGSVISLGASWAVAWATEDAECRDSLGAREKELIWQCTHLADMIEESSC